MLTLFPKIQNIKYYFVLFSEFFYIYNYIKNISKLPLDVGSLNERLLRWLKVYTQIEFEKNITPYIHIFVHHIGDFIIRHGDINLFNLQGLEYKQHVQSINYHRSSNKKFNDKKNSKIKKNYIRQCFEKVNRMEVHSVINKEIPKKIKAKRVKKK